MIFRARHVSPWPHDRVGEAEYDEALRSIVVPALRAFDPQLVLVASGFDAVAGDDKITGAVITSGKELNPLQRLDQGARGTWFPALSSPASARKAWIGGHLEPRGEIRLDAGAVKAMTSGKSLLPAGVTSVSGSFSRGDAVTLLNPEGRIIGRGLIAYDADEAQLIAGRNSREIEAIVGYPGRAEMIHRDDLVLELPALE